MAAVMQGRHDGPILSMQPRGEIAMSSAHSMSSIAAMSVASAGQSSPRFLRRALAADAIVSGAVGLLMITGAGMLSALLGLDRALLLGGGLVLVPFVALVGWLATRDRPASGAVSLAIAANVLWALACAGLWFASATGAGAPATLLGEAFIALHIVTVLAFAALEFIGLRLA